MWCGGMGEKEHPEIEMMENEELVKKVYRSSVEGPKRKGRPLGRWKDRVKEYLRERGARRNVT